MAKNKMLKYHQVQSFRNVLDFSHYRPNIMYDSKGEWKSFHFKNEHPIILELACGKGDYAVSMAGMYPQKNFIGIDIKGERIWKGASEAIKQQLDNVLFIRGYIDHITNMFGEAEIDEVWITFPDPYLKDRKEEKRLTHPEFLERYRKIMKKDGIVHLKTDSDELYDFTLQVIEKQNLEIIQKIDDVYAMGVIPDILLIQTYYEKKHIKAGKTIRYISFRL